MPKSRNLTIFTKTRFMKRSVSALYSSYVIDGARMDYTPAQMLDDCMPAGERERTVPEENFDSIVDEIVEHAPRKTAYDRAGIMGYLKRLTEIRDSVRMPATAAPGSFTRRKIASALLDTIWKKGHFTLEDLWITLQWSWDSAPLGNMAAFYRSAEAASQYLFDLGLRLDSYSFEKVAGTSDITVKTSVENDRDDKAGSDYDFFNEQNGHDGRELRYCWISDEEKCGSRLVSSPSSWLVYIPFDTCEYRLGDSLFEKAAGTSGDSAPEIQDPDYFIDCFEVVRELIEDGVIMAGVSVGQGGLAFAAASMCGESTGISIDISGIERAEKETDALRLLFSEVPGVLIQIQDADYDYMDSQLLLQDIAYFPLGHPSDIAGIDFTHGRKGVSDILASLLQGNIPEDDQDA